MNTIPAFLIAILGEVIPGMETHASIDSLFMYAGASGDPPDENKQVKVQEWLRRTNKDPHIDAYEVLGYILEHYLEKVLYPSSLNYEHQKSQIDQIRDGLERAELRYANKKVYPISLSPASQTLEEKVRCLDAPALNYEFDRALKSAASNPYEAVSAAANILECIFKVYIEDNQLEMPSKKTLLPLWQVVKAHLNIGSTHVADKDIQQILTGLASIMSGIAALRTHASSAHGRGRFRYTLTGRHSQLAVGSAHVLANFILETWLEKRQ